MQILVSYVYAYGDWGWEDRRPLPSDRVRTTGRYKTVNGELFIEIEEKRRVLFWLKLATRWISESSVIFTEVEHFDCSTA